MRVHYDGAFDEWESITRAAEETSVTAGKISQCCLGRISFAGDWEWIFAEDFHDPPEDEEWKEMRLYGDMSKCHHVGRIRLLNGKITVGSLKEGYRVHQTASGGMFKIHRLVAVMFIPNPDKLPVVNHKDDNRENNKVSNLMWCTQKTNCILAAQRKNKPVRRILPDGSMIIYESGKAASIASGVSRGDISSACRGQKKSPGGSKWEYA